MIMYRFANFSYHTTRAIVTGIVSPRTLNDPLGLHRNLFLPTSKDALISGNFVDARKLMPGVLKRQKFPTTSVTPIFQRYLLSHSTSAPSNEEKANDSSRIDVTSFASTNEEKVNASSQISGNPTDGNKTNGSSSSKVFWDEALKNLAKMLVGSLFVGAGMIIDRVILSEKSEITDKKEEKPESGTTNISPEDHDIKNYQSRKNLEEQLSTFLPLFSPDDKKNRSTNRVAITGRAGSGKTALAKHFAFIRFEEAVEKYGKSNVFVWLLDAQNEHVLLQSYLKFVTQKNLGFDIEKISNKLNFHRHRTKDDSEDISLINEFVKEKLLENNYYVLLIFDDVGKFESIKKYIPSHPDLHIDILITCKEDEFFNESHLEGNNISMNSGFESEENVKEGIQIFRHYLTNATINCSEDEIKPVIKILKYPSEIIEGATVFNLNVKNSLEKNVVIQNIISQSESYNNHRILVERLKKDNNEIIIKLLNICCFLKTSQMSTDLIKEIANYYGDGRSVDYFLTNLKEFNFINVNGSTFNIHESVQKKHQIWLERQGEYNKIEIFSDYSKILLKLFSFTSKINSTESLTIYLEHAKFLIGLCNIVEKQDSGLYNIIIRLFNNLFGKQEKLKENLMGLIGRISIYRGWVEDNYEDGIYWCDKGLEIYNHKTETTKEREMLRAKLLENKALHLFFSDRPPHEYIKLAKKSVKIIKNIKKIDEEITITSILNLIFLLIESRGVIDNALEDARKYFNEIEQYTNNINDVSLVDTICMLKHCEGADFNAVYKKLEDTVLMNENSMDYGIVYANNHLVYLILKEKKHSAEWLRKAKDRLNHNLELFEKVDENHFRRMRALTLLSYAKISQIENDYHSTKKYIEKCMTILQSPIYIAQQVRIEAEEIAKQVKLKEIELREMQEIEEREKIKSYYSKLFESLN